MNRQSKKRNKRKSKNKRRRVGNQSMEWIIGRLTMPFYITEDQPFRPEMFLCFELPSCVIVKHALIDPNGPPMTVSDILEEAFESPSAGPPRKPHRIRVDSRQMAEEIRHKHPEFDVVVAPTPELDEVLETFEESQPFQDTESSYLEEGRVSKEAVASFFRAAEMLYRVAPWRWVGDTQIIQVDVPDLGVHRGCVSIIGAASESFGFIIFPSIEAFESFLEHTQRPRASSDKLDLGSSMISVNFERGADLPASLRKEVARYGWPVAGPDAYPWVMCVDKDNLARPLSGRDIQLVEVCASSLATFTAKNRKMFEADEYPQVCETYTNEDDVAVTLTTPGEFVDDDHLGEAQPEISGNIKIGRNEPCPCGSGKKYKKCCQQKNDEARAQAYRPASVHALDDQLVGKMLKFGAQRFGETLHKAEEDFDVPDSAMQLFVPWMVYHFSIEGKPVVDWFVDHERKRLSDREMSWLESQKAAWLSLWEVIDVVPGEKITLKDLLTGEKRTVHEVQGSRNIRPRHVILARVVDYHDISIIGGSYPHILPPVDAAAVVRRMKKRLRRKKDVPVARLRDEKIGRFMIARWEDAVLDMDMRMHGPPTLQNTDGDDLLLTVDHFQIETKDAARIKERLLSIADTEYDEHNKSIVFTREGSGVVELESVTVGRARIEEDKLLVETNSQKRANDLRVRLEFELGQEIRHLVRSHQDPLKGIEDFPDQSAFENEIPPEIAAEAIRAFKEKHYSTWPDVPLSALGGKTPKEVVRTKQGREQVDLLLKDCENTEAALPEVQRYNFSALRRKLGLRN